MKLTTEQRQLRINKILKSLSLCYKDTSGPYQDVQKMLQKLSNKDLDALYVMVLTSVPGGERDV